MGARVLAMHINKGPYIKRYDRLKRQKCVCDGIETISDTNEECENDICLMFGSCYRIGLCESKSKYNFEPSRKTLINNL